MLPTEEQAIVLRYRASMIALERWQSCFDRRVEQFGMAYLEFNLGSALAAIFRLEDEMCDARQALAGAILESEEGLVEHGAGYYKLDPTGQPWFYPNADLIERSSRP